ncbi:MAG: DUF4097 family beta strand repeat protein [Catenulisporales bacterium]|jgi:hypothetical protein|nr:DUF4097 family beta strand repeat protein [Catenulisporales bacterium]
MVTFATPKPITAALTTAGARVQVVAGERTDTVVRVEPINSADKTDVKVAEKTEVEFSDGELSIRTNKAGDKNGSVAITVELPVGSRLNLNLAWSEVAVDGRLGDCELEMASGQVRLDQVAALRGRMAAGSVAVGRVAGPVDIEGATGGVRMGEVEGVVRYQGSSGRVWIGHALSDVDFRGANGSFDIDRAEGDVVAEAADCPIRIGRMTRGRAQLMNASGGIEVVVAENSATAVDAESRKGSVRDSVSAQDASADSTDQVEVYARTRRDDIVIRFAGV